MAHRHLPPTITVVIVGKCVFVEIFMVFIADEMIMMMIAQNRYCEMYLIDAFVAAILGQRVKPHWVTSCHATRYAEFLYKVVFLRNHH